MSKVKFITLTTHHSGSSPFQRMLDSHPDIKARQEDMRGRVGASPVLSKRVMGSVFSSPEHAAGFKLMYSHIRDYIWEYILENNVKIIQYIRRNVLDCALWNTRHISGDFEGGLGPPLIVKGKVKADIEGVINEMKQIHQWIDEYPADLLVYYEDALDNSQYMVESERKRVLEFLGVEDRELYVPPGKNKKNTRPPNEEVVVNYKELIERIKNEGVMCHR